jgi:hypothetical protein
MEIISIYMNDAQSMSGSLKGFITLANKRTLELFLQTVSCTERLSFQNQ